MPSCLSVFRSFHYRSLSNVLIILPIASCTSLQFHWESYCVLACCWVDSFWQGTWKHSLICRSDSSYSNGEVIFIRCNFFCPRPSRDNIRSSTHWATKELQLWQILVSKCVFWIRAYLHFHCLVHWGQLVYFKFLPKVNLITTECTFYNHDFSF